MQPITIVIESVGQMHTILHDMGETACGKPAFYSATLHQIYGKGRYYPSSKAEHLRLLFTETEPETGIPLRCGSCGETFETVEVNGTETWTHPLIPWARPD